MIVKKNIKYSILDNHLNFNYYDRIAKEISAMKLEFPNFFSFLRGLFMICKRVFGGGGVEGREGL